MTHRDKFSKIHQFLTCDKSWADDRLKDTKYKHPLDNNYIECKISGSYGIHNAEDYFLHSKESHIYETLTLMKSYIYNVPYNSSGKYYLDEVYVDGEEEEASNVERLKNATQHANDLRRPVIVTGERGSGKSATQLVYLYRFREELIAKNIFLLRCDVHELYEAWIRSGATVSNLISLKDYLDLYLAYVLCKFKDDSEKTDIYNIMSIILNDEHLTYQKIKKASHDKKTEVSVKDEVNSTSSNIASFEKSDRPRSFLMEEWIKNAQNKNNELQRQFNNSKALSHVLTNSIISTGRTILYYIDGCDNVDVTKKHGFELYKKFLAELLSFCYKLPPNNVSYVIFMRKKTLGEIIKMQSCINAQGVDHVRPNQIEFTPVCCSEISRQRFEYIKREIISTLDPTKYKPIIMAINELLSECGDDSIPLYDRLAINHNIRDYLHNKLSLITIISYISRLEKNLTFFDGENNGYEVHINIESWSERNKFLNGNLYLNTPQHGVGSSTPGCIYFNPFHCEPNYSKWNGMLYLRLYQTIKRLNTTIEEDLVKYLIALFEYDSDLIKQSVEICETFGLIEISHQECGSNVLKRQLKLNDKFDCFIEHTFKDADVLYYLALDSYLPENIFSAEIFNCHSNKIKEKSNYNNAMPFATTMFMRFLIIKDRIEKENLEFRLSKLLKRNKNLSLDISDFTLPILQEQSYVHVINRIIHVIEYGSEASKNIFYNKFINCD